MRSVKDADRTWSSEAPAGVTPGIDLTIWGFAVKASREREFWTMRGLVMALFALDFPGHDGSLKANHWAGRIGVPFQSSINSDNTTAKTITKTTAKTV